MTKNIIKNLKYDFPASVVVWLVALPLCLGIGAASTEGNNVFAGIISGIVGGIIVTILSGSRFGVSGPAAGLISIVLMALEELQHFEVFILAVALSGIIQFLMGQFRLGVVGYFIPVSVINGMLASIGLTLILKQIPRALGVDKDSFGNLAFNQADGENTFTEIIKAFDIVSIEALLIFSLSVVLMISWDSKRLKKIKLS